MTVHSPLAAVVWALPAEPAVGARHDATASTSCADLRPSASEQGPARDGDAQPDEEDVQGSFAAPATAMAYPWKHFIGGHMGRLGTRDDLAVYQQYVDDIIAGVKKALVAVDPTPFFAKHGDNA